MNTFNDFINNCLNESIVDVPRNSLDHSVFEFPEEGLPILHPIIKMQIINDISSIDSAIRVVDYYMVGSILTNRYNATTDIDVNVQVQPNDDIEKETALDLIKNINGRLAAGTTHPINYYIITKKFDITKSDAIYDIENEKWIKEPAIIDINLKNYMDKFKTTVDNIDISAAELRRDIIDLEELKTFKPNQLNELKRLTNKKIEEIEQDMENLVNDYQHIKSVRSASFEHEMNPKEIKKYGSKSKLPANVVYKMIERYYYFDFIKKIKEILEKDKNISVSDINKIKQAGKEFWK